MVHASLYSDAIVLQMYCERFCGESSVNGVMSDAIVCVPRREAVIESVPTIVAIIHASRERAHVICPFHAISVAILIRSDKEPFTSPSQAISESMPIIRDMEASICPSQVTFETTFIPLLCAPVPELSHSIVWDTIPPPLTASK